VVHRARVQCGISVQFDVLRFPSNEKRRPLKNGETGRWRAREIEPRQATHRRVHLALVELRFFARVCSGSRARLASEICPVKPLKAIPSQFKFPPPFRLENEQDERDETSGRQFANTYSKPRAASAKFHSLAGRGRKSFSARP